MVLVIIGERRTLWMVRIYYLDLASTISTNLRLMLLEFCAGKLVIGSAVAMAAVIFQSFAGF